MRPMALAARKGCGADDGDFIGELGEPVELGTAMEGFDGVGAGEEKPVVGAEAGEGGVECGEGGRVGRSRWWG